MRLLYAEDERDLNEVVTRTLLKNHYSVDSCFDGEEALDCLAAAEYDAVILDIMMPRVDGLTVLSRLRARGNRVPVLLLTARDGVSDRVKGLDSGADDYLVKPFALEELLARVRALLRRAAGVQRDQGAVLAVGDMVLNTEERVAVRDGRTVDLTAKEYDLIELLMRNPRRVYSRENLMNVVWGYSYAGDYRTVDVHIRRLREKLEKNPAEPDHIMTKWGVGYYFKP